MSTGTTPPPAHAVDADTNDRGYSLVEILVSIVLMSTVVVVLLAGMFTVIRTSTVTKEQGAVEAVLGSAADLLISEARGFDQCPEDGSVYGSYQDYVTKAADSVGWSTSTVTIDEILYWDVSANGGQGDWSTQNPFGDPCVASGLYTPATNMQKVTVRVTAPSGNISRTMDVVIADIQYLEI